MRQIFFATKLLTNNSQIFCKTQISSSAKLKSQILQNSNLKSSDKSNLKSSDKNVSRAHMRDRIVAIKNPFRASRS